MVDIKETRKFRVEDGLGVAVKIQEYQNGAGRGIIHTTEEFGLDIKEVDDVLNIHQPKDEEKVREEIAKLITDIADMELEIGESQKTEEYKKFMEYTKSEEYQEQFKIFSKVKALNQGKAQLKLLEQDLSNIKGWKKQFEGLKAALE